MQPSTTTITNKILGSLWHTIALVLLLVAVSLSTFRLLLPEVDRVNAHMSHLLSEQLGTQVTITKLSGAWEGAGPQLRLSDVTLGDPQFDDSTLTIEELFISLDFLSSLSTLSIVTDKFEISGADIHIYQSNIRSEQSPTPFTSQIQDVVLNKLEYFSVLDSKIQLHLPGRTHRINIKQMSWLNGDVERKGRGLISIDERPDNVATVAVRLLGPKEALDGVIYLQANNIAFKDILAPYLAPHTTIVDSHFDAQLWVNIQQSSIDHIEGRLNGAGIEFLHQTRPNTTLSIKLSEVDISAQPTTTDWRFSLNNIALQIDDTQINTAILGSFSSDGYIQLALQKPLALEPFVPLAHFFAATGTQPWLNASEFTGHLVTADVAMRADTIYARAQLNDINTAETTVPGIKSANVQLDLQHIAQQTDIAIDLRAQDTQLLTHTLLTEDLTVEHLNGQIHVQVTPHTWALPQFSLTANTHLSAVSLAGSYHSGSEYLSLVGTFDPQTVTNMTKLLPERYLGKTYTYLQEALATPTQTGEVEDVKILWHGRGSDFPFNDGSGVFQAHVDVVNTDFLFAQNWPSLTELVLKLRFENADLTMLAPSGKLLDVDVSDMVATIPDLSKDSLLTIDALGAGTGFAFSQVMRHSSLGDSVGKLLLENIIISNDVDAALNLHIPLSEGSVSASGTVNLPNNYVVFNDIDTTLTHAKGAITFINDRITIEDLEANLLDQPILISVNTYRSEEDFNADIRIDGYWDSAILASKLDPTYAEIFAGSDNWTSDIGLVFSPDNMAYDFTLLAQLDNTQIDLPPPFATMPGQRQHLKITGFGDSKTLNVSGQLGEDVRFEGVLPFDEGQFSRAHLALGQTDFTGLGMGFSISANLPEVSIPRWYEAIERMLSTVKTESRNNIFSTPERIFIDTQVLYFAGQQISDVRALAKQSDNNWQIDIAAKEAKGNVQIFNDWLGSGIVINADYINFAQWQEDEGELYYQKLSPEQVNTLPPIQFACVQCTILGKNLGQVQIATKPSENGLVLEKIAFQTNYGVLDASGTWSVMTEQKNNGNFSQTALKGEFTSSNFGRFLDDFGLESGIQDSAGQFNFDLNWQAVPYELDFASMNGAVKWRLDDGYLSEVSDQGSRIFTVLSLDSLVRKLSLDFRDVFAKGFFYDEIAGTIVLENGLALTDDTVVDGGAGEIEIMGYSDLVNRELNYQMSFAPNVTGNLPALVYFMVNPPTALAALAVNEVLTSAKVFSNVNYSVRGTFSDPVITEVSRKSQEIQLPARTNPTPRDTPAPITELDREGLPVILPEPSTKPESNADQVQDKG